MKDITPGIIGRAEITSVTEEMLAKNVGSGSLEVFSTPSMAALMEKAACSCVAEYLEGDETTVGTELNIRHTSASPGSISIYAEAELTAVDGRELSFEVRAFDSCGAIGSGTHKRFVVSSGRFMNKTLAKIK
ncbi:MAG: thioesterase family protein [Ruminococcus sp.]|nr:thioesterase family protein [Ruminococcus sp.]